MTCTVWSMGDALHCQHQACHHPALCSAWGSDCGGLTQMVFVARAGVLAPLCDDPVNACSCMSVCLPACCSASACTRAVTLSARCLTPPLLRYVAPACQVQCCSSRHWDCRDWMCSASDSLTHLNRYTGTLLPAPGAANSKVVTCTAVYQI